MLLNTAVISFLFITIHYYFDDVFNTNANRHNAVEACRDDALNSEQTGRVSEGAVSVANVGLHSQGQRDCVGLQRLWIPYRLFHAASTAVQ